MEIFRFDEEVAVPVSDFGSNFGLSPLIGGDARVAVSVLHLPAGGSVGRHPATANQLFAVVSGSGWASGGDGRRRPVPAGRAAFFEAGESHEAGTELGLIAVCIEGSFALHATRVTQDIVVEPYDPVWREWFAALVAFVWPAVGEVAIRIDHVGSTAVPGLAAKPIVDLDVVVAAESDVARAIEGLRSIGYRWRGDLGVPGRQYFSAPAIDLPPHHLYLVVENSKAHLDHRLLVEVLLADPEKRRRYGELKRQNAASADRDMEVYVALKAAFVAELLTEARAERGLPAETYWVPEPPPADN
jgi:GrpB-like predicted nucleotidyltransferase (UPF0157 family)/quercetin dioxygenase-like cupin family protein